MEKMTTIISAFPGCGKSVHYGNSLKGELIVLDSDSSNFSWVKDENGENTKERNPNFPSNYIEHINENIGKADIISVSSHDIVRNALEYNDLPYTLVYPSNSTIKKKWLNRFVGRGDNINFIQFIENNWDKFTTGMEDETYPTHFRLDECQYLSTLGLIGEIREKDLLSKARGRLLKCENRKLPSQRYHGEIFYSEKKSFNYDEFCDVVNTFKKSMGLSLINLRGEGTRIEYLYKDLAFNNTTTTIAIDTKYNNIFIEIGTESNLDYFVNCHNALTEGINKEFIIRMIAKGE